MGRQDQWTGSIAVGSGTFIEKIKELLGFRAKGRDVVEGDEGYHLREETGGYRVLFEAEKGDISPDNTHLWDVNNE